MKNIYIKIVASTLLISTFSAYSMLTRFTRLRPVTKTMSVSRQSSSTPQVSRVNRFFDWLRNLGKPLSETEKIEKSIKYYNKLYIKNLEEWDYRNKMLERRIGPLFLPEILHRYSKSETEKKEKFEALRLQYLSKGKEISDRVVELKKKLEKLEPRYKGEPE